MRTSFCRKRLTWSATILLKLPQRVKRPFVSVRQPACEPMYESKPGWWIAKQMAKRLDLDAYFPWSSPEDHLRRVVEPLGLNQSELMSLGAVFLRG